MAALTAEKLRREADRLSVTSVDDPAAALGAIDAAGADCLVSDYQLPGTTGLDLFHEVREAHPDLPFVLFTGQGDEAVAAEAVSAGVTDYITKGSAEQFGVLANSVLRAVRERRTRRQLSESRRRFVTLVEQLPGMAYRCRNEHGWPMEFVSDGARDLTGHDPDALEADEVDWESEVIHPADRERTWAVVQDALDAREPFSVTYRIRRADGEVRHVYEQGSGVFEDGEVIALEGYIQDVTDRHRRERTLTRLHEATRSFMDEPSAERIARIGVETAREVLDLPASGVFLLDESSGRLENVANSREATRNLGEPPTFAPGEGIVGSTFESGEPAVLADAQADERAAGHGSSAIRSLCVLPLGEFGVFTTGSVEAGALSDREVELTKVLAANVEAALRRAEREAELAEQNDRLDRFAAVVSHDLRNPLNVAAGNVDLAREELGDGAVGGGAAGDESAEDGSRAADAEELERARTRLETAADALDRGEALVARLLGLARHESSLDADEPVPLDRVARDAWSSVRTDDATLAVRIGAAVEADAERLRTLLEHLFRNAVDHAGGDVTVSVERLPDGEGFAVADDGAGLPADDADRLFDAGVSSEGGTGLGLAVVATVADEHGWEPSATSDDGARFAFRGVTFAAADEDDDGDAGGGTGDGETGDGTAGDGEAAADGGDGN